MKIHDKLLNKLKALIADNLVHTFFDKLNEYLEDSQTPKFDKKLFFKKLLDDIEEMDDKSQHKLWAAETKEFLTLQLKIVSIKGTQSVGGCPIN